MRLGSICIPPATDGSADLKKKYYLRLDPFPNEIKYSYFKATPVLCLKIKELEGRPLANSSSPRTTIETGVYSLQQVRVQRQPILLSNI